MPNTVAREFGDILLEIGAAAMQRQDRCSGAMPGGHNGPYQDPETPVRNTAHWVRAFNHCHEISGDGRFRDAALAAAHYLIGNDAPRSDFTFAHRDKDGKDQCNGLVGQAWTIEGLVAAHRSLGVQEAAKIAEDVFLAHPFDPVSGLWRRVEPDGSVLTADLTFNHQLWFAAAGGLLARHASPEVGRRVTRFLECVPALMSVSHRGRILHPIRTAPRRARRLAARVLLPHRRFNLMIKEVGYQTFNLYAFAMLHEEYPEHAIWDWRGFRHALAWLDDGEFRSNIGQSIYGFPYNPPGFEIPVIFGAFFPHNEHRKKDSAAWLQRQLRHVYRPESGFFSGDGIDEQSLTARIYECSRFASSMLKVRI